MEKEDPENLEVLEDQEVLEDPEETKYIIIYKK